MRLKTNAKRIATRALRGFSLVEVMTGAAVVGVVFISLYAAITSGFGMISLARENLRAIQIMQEKFETLRLYNWNQVNTAGFIPTNFTASFYPVGNTNYGVTYSGTMLITNFPTTESYSTNMRLVTLTVTWTSGAVQRSRQLQTAIARYGLQNYVY